MRIKSVIKKEFKEYSRDKGYILTMILVPLLIMLVFGYTFQLDITNLNTIVIDDDHSQYSQSIIDSIDESEYFSRIDFDGTLEDGKEMLRKSEARALFYIPQGFEDDLKNATKADVILFLDSSDYSIYNFLKGASADVIKGSLKDIVQFIVSDLEQEREEKQQKIDEIQELVNDVDAKARKTISQVDNLTAQFDESRDLISETEVKINNVKNETQNINADVEDMIPEIRDSVERLDELEDSLLQLKAADPNLSVYIDPILDNVDYMQNDISKSLDKLDSLDPLSRIPVSSQYYNMDEFRNKLDRNEVTASEINATAHELEGTYSDVQSRIDAIYLELRTLKKDFLSHPLDIERKYLFGEISYFNYLTPAIITLVLFFIGVMLTTINIVDERNKKTLFRISTTPLKKWELFGGKFVIFFILGLVEVVYVLLLAKFFFNVTIAGSLLSSVVVLLLLMAASIGLGLLISSLVKTMRQAVMLVPLVIIPSVLISQTFSPIEVMPKFMQYIAYLSPMLYSNVALREIMIKGTSLGEVIVPVIVLGVYALLALGMGVLISKKRIE